MGNRAGGVAEAEINPPGRRHRVRPIVGQEGGLVRAITTATLRASGPTNEEETPMDDVTKREPVQIRAEDINPRYNWGRALPALGTMGVDFEERVDYRRLHKYRIGRARQALENSELGALLVFDVNNIRYLTSTKIGE